MHIPSGSWWKHSAINYVSHGLSERSFAHFSMEARPLKREPKENVSQHWEKGAVAFSHKPTGDGGAVGPASCQYLVPTCLAPGTDLALAGTRYTPCRCCRIKQLKRIEKGKKNIFLLSRMTKCLSLIQSDTWFLLANANPACSWLKLVNDCGIIAIKDYMQRCDQASIVTLKTGEQAILDWLP